MDADTMTLAAGELLHDLWAVDTMRDMIACML